MASNQEWINQWAKIEKEIVMMVGQKVEKGLDAAAKEMEDELERVSPFMEHAGEHIKNSWDRKTYTKKRYVGSTKRVKYQNRMVPLSSLLEYGKNSKHKGFIRKAFNNAKPRLIQAFKNAIRG